MAIFDQGPRPISDYISDINQLINSFNQTNSTSIPLVLAPFGASEMQAVLNQTVQAMNSAMGGSVPYFSDPQDTSAFIGLINKLNILGGSARKFINWVAEGDSITAGLGGVPAWPNAALAAMPGGTPSTPGTNTPTSSIITGVGGVNLHNIATSGISSITINTNYATRAGATFDATKSLNVLSLMIGTNTSGSGDTTAEQKFFQIRSYIRKAQATGYDRVAVGTITARNDDGGTFWNSTLVPLNNYIRTLYNSDLRSDALIDFGNDARFGSPAAAANSTYYDTVTPPIDLHPNVFGEFTMGSIAEPVVLSVLQGPGAKVISPTLTFSRWDANASAAFANSDTTLTAGQAGCLPEFKAGKWYWEINVDAVGTSGGGVGLFNSDTGFNVASQALFNGNSFVWAPTTGTAMKGAGAGITPGNFTTADRLQFALDYSNPAAVLLWMRFNRAGTHGNWNGIAAANPATRANGLDITTLAAAPGYLRPAAACGTSASYSVKFSAASLADAPPAGFSAFGP